MPVEAPIEERLAAVEAAIVDIQRRLPPTAANWPERVIGSLKDEPAFEEILAYGREFRDADRPQMDDES